MCIKLPTIIECNWPKSLRTHSSQNIHRLTLVWYNALLCGVLSWALWWDGSRDPSLVFSLCPSRGFSANRPPSVRQFLHWGDVELYLVFSFCYFCFICFVLLLMVCFILVIFMSTKGRRVLQKAEKAEIYRKQLSSKDLGTLFMASWMLCVETAYRLANAREKGD